MKVTTTRTYRSINRPLTILGVERRLFFVALGGAVATFNMFSSLLGGMGMFAVLFGFGRWASVRDPAILAIVLASSRQHAYYDPLKCTERGRL